MLKLLAFIPGVGPILAGGSAIFSNWKLILGGVAALGIGGCVWSWHERGVTIAEQQVTIGTLTANLKEEQTRSAIAAAGADIAYQRLQDTATNHTNVTTLMEGARNAQNSSDGAIAPVLRSTLDGIGRLRKPATP